MAHTIQNILDAQGQRKLEFIEFFSTQTSSLDKTIAEILSDDTDFSAAIVTFVRLSLSHLNDNTKTITNRIVDLYQGLNTNFSTSRTSNLQEPLPPSFNLDTHTPQRINHHDNNRNRKHNKTNYNQNGNNQSITNAAQTTRKERDTNNSNNVPSNQDLQHNKDATPKKETTPHNNTNKNASRVIVNDVSRDPTFVDAQNEKHMDLDIDIIRPAWNDIIITHDSNDAQLTMSTNDINHNPWSDPTTTADDTIQQPSQPLEFKSVLDIRQNANFDTIDDKLLINHC